MLHHSFVTVLIVALAVASAPAQEPAAEPKRGAYVVKYAGARDLSAILARHFKGAAEIQVGPGGTSNTLLVNAPPPVFDEVMKAIELLDRKPHSVAIEVFVIELPAKKDDGKDTPGIDEKDLSGAIGDVARSLNALQRKGQVAGVRRIRLTGGEGHAASLTVGESRPYTAGRGSVSYGNTGTQVQVTPRVAGDRTITIDLSVQDSRMVLPEGGQAPEFPMTSLTSRVSVASGTAVLAKDADSTEKSAAGRTLVVVGARLVEPK